MVSKQVVEDRARKYAVPKARPTNNRRRCQKQVSNDKNYRSKNSRHQILKSELGNRTFQVHRQLYLEHVQIFRFRGQVLAYVVERGQIKNRLTRCLGPLFTN